jgi:hypothetical protein
MPKFRISNTHGNKTFKAGAILLDSKSTFSTDIVTEPSEPATIYVLLGGKHKTWKKNDQNWTHGHCIFMP